MVFSRNKSSDATSPAPDPIEEAEAIETAGSAGKGRPTPKRKESEAANKRPLVPSDRRAAAKEARQKQRAARERQYQAMQTGDERYLPARDKGPMKRYIRDYVDARWNLGEFFLPVAFVFIAAVMLTSRNPEFAAILILVLYAFLVLTIIDGIVMWRRLRRRLTATFGDVPRGHLMYALTRGFQLRRLRMPKPMNPKHGTYPQ